MLEGDVLQGLQSSFLINLSLSGYRAPALGPEELLFSSELQLRKIRISAGFLH
jgi:hypothetical protein